MAQVFISYRRPDADHARLIHDRLASELSPDVVFMDVDTLVAGADWARAVTESIRAMDVVIVLIGPGWLGAANSGRLHDPADLIRLELSEALRRKEVWVIPVLVGGASMPNPGGLPDELQDLARMQPLTIPKGDGAEEIANLVSVIRRRAWANVPGGGTAIFVCYRREDSRWPAGRLADALRERFGEEQVFMDVDRVRIGDWRERINEALDASAVVVVLIGISWLEELNRRAEQSDEVRYEIATALGRGKVVLPVTLGRAQIPSPDDLPDDLAPLVDQEVYQLGEDRLWRPTLAILLDDLATALRS